MPDRPLITLTTDFGLTDHYVGTMKGVILCRCPEARIVDISHEIERFSIWAGAYAIDQAAPFFPKRTTHVIVVDPGVGTRRRPILAEACGQQFIAPDNGVLSLILDRDPKASVREISNRNLWLPAASSTFHGRDIFSPTAAAIASGRALLEEVGPRVTDPARLRDAHPVEEDRATWRGRILSIDRFGNLITNFKTDRFWSTNSALLIGSHEVSARRLTFGEAQADELFLYPGSSSNLEIGLNRQSAALRLEASTGQTIKLKMLA